MKIVISAIYLRVIKQVLSLNRVEITTHPFVCQSGIKNFLAVSDISMPFTQM